MSLGTRPNRRPDRRYGGGKGGPPPWLIFLLGVALVFGLYYLWLGVRDFMETGGLGIVEATERAVIVETATAAVAPDLQRNSVTPRPSNTPIPECADFIVSVPSAIVRAQPSTSAPIVDSFPQGTIVCVISRAPESEWYLIDSNPETRRLNAAYMHESVIEAVNPTPTPSNTFTPNPTVTPLPTNSPTTSPSPAPTATRDPRITDTPTPTLTPSPTEALQNV